MTDEKHDEKPTQLPAKPTHPIATPPHATQLPAPTHPIVQETKEELAAKKEAAEIKAEQAKDKAACLDKIQEILAAAGGESNIGITSEYWSLLNEYRSYP